MVAPFLVRALQQRAAENTQLYMQDRQMQQQMEMQEKVNQLALESRKKQMEMEKEAESTYNKEYGKSIFENAYLLPGDNKVRDRARFMGQMMMETGMSPEIIAPFIKPGISEELGQAKLELEKQKVIQAGQRIKQSERRMDISEGAQALAKQRFKLSEKIYGEKAPESVKSALMSYRKLIDLAAQDVSQGRQSDMSDALQQYQGEIDTHSAIINQWADELGFPTVPTIEEETENPGLIKSFLMKYANVPAAKKTKLGTKNTAQKPVANTVQKTWKERASQLRQENSKITPQEIVKKLKEEGIKIE